MKNNSLSYEDIMYDIGDDVTLQCFTDINQNTNQDSDWIFL